MSSSSSAIAAAAATAGTANSVAATASSSAAQQMTLDENVSTPLRAPTERPIYKLSVRLIDTYKYINKVYYEAKAQKLKDQKDSARGGVHNDGYDDQNYDYILQGDEILMDRYILKHRMGKGSFGQVVCAYDRENKCEVAIKIIKSRKPFLIQARTEIDILQKVLERDRGDESNIVRMQDQFMYRNHQCLVFEILSFNLYELLKNTKFRGVSLNLIRKFSRQLIKALEFLNREDVNIIHCDLKPENILLRHPRRSAIKLIDFGSSCYLTKRTYSYIQSRFYRSPEVLLGLPYTQKIDLWSLGCVAVEMHTGEPLFGGTNQVDQMCRIVDVLGMPPLEMIKASPEKTRTQFFEQIAGDSAEAASLSGLCDTSNVVFDPPDPATRSPGVFYVLKRPLKDLPKPRTLADIIGVYTGGPGGRRKTEADHTPQKYEEFLDFVCQLLQFKPTDRQAPHLLAQHPYLTTPDAVQPPPPPPPAVASTASQNNSSSSSAANMPPQPPASNITGLAAEVRAQQILRQQQQQLQQQQLQQQQQQQAFGSGNATAMDTAEETYTSEKMTPPLNQSDAAYDPAAAGQFVADSVLSKPSMRLNQQEGNIATLSSGAPVGAVLSTAINDPSFALAAATGAAADAQEGQQQLLLNSRSSEMATGAAGVAQKNSSNSSNSKDVNRGRRGEGATGANKIRSQSAPGGSQSHVRLLDGTVAGVSDSDQIEQAAQEDTAMKD